MTESVTEVVDVATQRLKYVPPQIEVVELERHMLLLSASSTSSSGKASWGNVFSDDGEEWSE